MQAQGKQSVITYAEFILSSKDFSELLTRSTAVMQILESNTDIMKALTEKEATLKGAEQKLENELVNLKKSQDELASEQKKVEADKVEMKKVLEDSKSTLKQQQTQLAKQQTQKNAQDKARQEAQEKARQEAQEKARQAAQERARQEAQERARQQATEKPNQQAPKPSANNPSVSDSPTDVPTNSGDANELIATAKQFLGVPYVWGGTSPSGFDCSGFTQYVFRSVGIYLPRVARDQQDVGTRISPYNVQKGDLVFRGNPAYHVGIYIGGGKYIHAPQTGDVVKIATYNPAKFTTAARVLH
jgi:peptidoglycan DL-endopeptidase CwlO